ncbi:MAG: hypothetical protein AMJ90_00805 [candidate division Zixibacteria bacterium SM23_73_2]|nr:MAG: hypothetical protein AMJ90_00805 [candidate division Zixibacteria bacterium SM23_73_2]
MKKKILVFTDLDGTLLDYHTYSFKPAIPALAELRKRGIPLIMCTSKTRAEIEVYQKKLKNHHPFIPENGGAIFLPKDYFKSVDFSLKEKDKYLVKEFGTTYQVLREKLFEVTGEFGLKVKGFGDMSPEEIQKDFGLSQNEASLAKKREYDEPFYFITSPEQDTLKIIQNEFTELGLNMVKGGKLFHLTGGSNKGEALRMLKKMYEKEWESELVSLGLGDSMNDLSMLLEVDYPVLVKLHNGNYKKEVLKRIKEPFLTEGIGPAGWNQAVFGILERIEKD